MDFLTILLILDSTLRLATPLLLACLAGLFSERAGVFDIGLEGKMLMAAFVAAAVAYGTGSAWIGLFAAILSSLVLSGLHGLAAIVFKGNQLISGVALNFLASGLTVLVAQALFGQGGQILSQNQETSIPVELVVVIQALVIMFTGALDNMVRAPLTRLFWLFRRPPATGKAGE